MDEEYLDTKPIRHLREDSEKNRFCLEKLQSQDIDAEIILVRRGIVIPYPLYWNKQINIDERKE